MRKVPDKSNKKGDGPIKIGYIRVSSKSQRDNSSLKEQREAVLKAGAEEVVEEIFTGGTIKDRPLFSKLLERLQPDDELIVCKLDRFARTVSEGSAVAKDLYDRNIKLTILNMGTIERSFVGTLILNIMLSFAEYEKDMINSRCQNGRMYHREHTPGYREGRPKKFRREQMNLALSLVEQGKSYRVVEEMTGISKTTIYREKKQRLSGQTSETEKSP